MMARTPLLEFGPFRLDFSERQLLCGDDPIPLTAKAFDVLEVLVRHRGRTITREEFMTEVWAGTVVEEANLTDNISLLRQVLGDDARDPRFIQTVPKRGYRFVAPVREVGAGEPDAAIDDVPPPPRNPRRMPSWVPALVVLLLVVMAVGFVAMRRKTAMPDAVREARSLAVLPFQPLTPSSRDAALELGMTDALIAKLSRIREISVRPTTAVLPYVETTASIAEIAGKLDVDTLLEGKVQKDGDRMRVSVQLVRASDGATIWADRFDERFTDIFAMQDAISERVADALQVRLTQTERASLTKRQTTSAEAYQLYLNGRHQWRTFTREGLLASINYYNAALKIDPDFALAWAGLSGSYSVIAIYGPIQTKEAFEKSKVAAEKGLSLDPDDAQTHVPMIATQLLYLRDWAGARRQLDIAQRLEPDNGDLFTMRGYYYQAMGQADKALEQLERAVEISPEWQIAKNDFLGAMVEARRYDEAIHRARTAIELDPTVAFSHATLGDALAGKGDYAAALESFRRATELSSSVRYIATLAWTEAKAGNRKTALDLIEQAKRDSSPWQPIAVAEAYAGLGDHDQVFVWLNRACDERFAFLWDIRNRHQFDAIRKDPRYAALLKRIGLSD